MTESVVSAVSSINIAYGTCWSDHYPVVLNMFLNKINKNIGNAKPSINRVIWGDRTPEQIIDYSNICNSSFREIDFPVQFSSDGFLQMGSTRKVFKAKT